MVKHGDRIPIRVKQEDYSYDAVIARQQWLSTKIGQDLSPIDALPYSSELCKKNIENLIGSISIPLAITGPIKVNGEYAQGDFYVPFATTQGTLVESYHRGMAAITHSGGAFTYIQENKVDITPMFVMKGTKHIPEFLKWMRANYHGIKDAAESTTAHGKLLNIKSFVIGRRVMLNFSYNTGDASGLNMINIACESACQYIKSNYPHIEHHYLRCNLSSDKKPSYFNFINSYGKRVLAEVIIPKSIVKRYLQTTPEKIHDCWISSLMGSIQAGMIGSNAHFANGLSCIFNATGQDIAQIVNACQGIGFVEVTPGGDLYYSVNLPCLIVATVGGGTSLPSQQKCLEIMGCAGTKKVEKFTEIIAATILGGEISIASALSCGVFAQADVKLRKR